MRTSEATGAGLGEGRISERRYGGDRLVIDAPCRLIKVTRKGTIRIRQNESVGSEPGEDASRATQTLLRRKAKNFAAGDTQNPIS